ncbi:hypothetical protein FHR91_002714 [Erythrobacter lutimaris]|nr:hypothetical protein [Alteriqipengyuania lutimaris]
MAPLQFADGLYGVPISPECDALAERYAMFAKRPSAMRAPYPEPLLAVAHGPPEVCPAPRT